MGFCDSSCESILDHIHDGLYFVNNNKIITYWNKAAERITGFTSEEVVGSSCSDNILTHHDGKGNSLCANSCPISFAMRDESLVTGEVFLHHKEGHRVPVSVRIFHTTDSSDRITGAVKLFYDMSDHTTQKARIKHLEKLALLDSLTKLANKTYIERKLHGSFDAFKRYGTMFGVVFIDIDNFKSLNGEYGHLIGDEVLKFVANTFLANARPFDLYGRWGGDEFIGIIHDIDGNDLWVLGNRLLSLVESSFTIHDGRKVSVTVSIGAALINKNDTIKSLLERADSHLYDSKSSGRNCLTIG